MKKLLPLISLLLATNAWGEGEGVSYTKHGIDRFNEKEWDKYSTNKALAIGMLGDKAGGYLCYGKSSVSGARVCAKSWCEAKGYPCFIAAVNAWDIGGKEEAQKAYAEAKEEYLKRQKKTPKGRRVTRKEIEKIEKRWKKDYANNKAIAAGSSKNGKVTGYICYEHSSLSSAMRCALKGCEAQGNACAIIVENNDTVDLKVAKENLEIARNNSSNSTSRTQSQSSSSLVDECLKRMEKAREKVVTSCSFSARTKQSGLSGALAVIGACKERARTQFPDVACYGAGLPPRLPPVGVIDPPSSSPDSTYEYVMTIESGFCPQTVRRPHIYMLDRSQRSGTKTICYYK